MARINGSPLGNIRGKLGSVVGSSWMGISYIRSVGGKRSKKRGRIEKHNQENFALVHRWLQPLLPFLKEGFKGYAPRVVGFNAAKSYALKNALLGKRGSKVFDITKVQVSYGDLPLPSHMHFEKKDNLVHFYWDSEVPQGASACDQAMLLVYNSEKSSAVNWKLTGQFRSVGEDTLRLGNQPGVYHVFIAFTADNRSRQSHSVYLGTVEGGV